MQHYEVTLESGHSFLVKAPSIGTAIAYFYRSHNLYMDIIGVRLLSEETRIIELGDDRYEQRR